MPVVSGQRPLQRAINTRLSPSSNWARGSLCFNNPDGVGGSLPSVFGTPDAATNPPPTPTASTLQPRESGGGRHQALRPPLGEPDPVAGTRDSGSPGPAAPPPPAPARAPFTTQMEQGLAPAQRPAPRSACSLSRMGASYAASGRQGLQEAARGRGAGQAPHPAGARGGPCAVPLALACLLGCPWAHWPLLVCGAASSHAPLPHSQTEITPPGGGPQRLPLARSLKETSAHSQDGFRAPPPGPEPAKARSP